MSTRSQQDQELEEHYKSLKLDWEFFKQSNPPKSTRPTIASETKVPNTAPSILDLMNTSPRKLVSSLQGNFSPSNGWNVRTNVLALEELMNADGKLKGRRLLDEFEDVLSENGVPKTEEVCSACSSELIQNGERNSCSCFFSGEEVGNNRVSSARSVHSGRSYIGASDDSECSDQRNGDRWMIRAGWLAFVLVIFALAIISWLSIDVIDEEQAVLVPT